MNTNCQLIDQIFSLLETEDNRVAGITKSSLVNKVVYMHDPISSTLKDKILTEFKSLVYKRTEASPHNASLEGFICKECNIAIVFPLS